MAKDYLAMIADIEESESQPYSRNVKRVKSPPTPRTTITPAALLAGSRHGCLTRGALRDALTYATGCTGEDALLIIGAYLEAGIIVVGPDEDELLRVRQ